MQVSRITNRTRKQDEARRIQDPEIKTTQGYLSEVRRRVKNTAKLILEKDCLRSEDTQAVKDLMEIVECLKLELILELLPLPEVKSI